MHLLKHWVTSESGATAIEYGLVAACISLAIAGAVMGFGETLQTLFYDGLADVLD